MTTSLPCSPSPPAVGSPPTPPPSTPWTARTRRTTPTGRSTLTSREEMKTTRLEAYMNLKRNYTNGILLCVDTRAFLRNKLLFSHPNFIFPADLCPH